MPIVKLVDRSGSLRFQFSNGLAGAVPGSRPIIGTVPAAGSQLEGTSPPPFLDPRSLPPRRLTSNDIGKAEGRGPPKSLEANGSRAARASRDLSTHNK
jgi:hypothetical protein